MKNNLELDHTMLAFALRGKQFTMELSNKVTHEYFDSKVQWLYSTVVDYFNNPKFKEVPTEKIIKEHLKKNYTQKSFIQDAIDTFQKVKDISVDPSEFSWYLEKLKLRHNKRIQRSCASDMIKIIKAGGDDEEVVEKVNEILHESVIAIDTINKQESYDEGTLAQSASSRRLRYEEIEANPELARGILTGFTELDRISNGLHDGELIIIGGSTGTGKSIMMHNIAANAYVGEHNPLEPVPLPENATGHNVLYFTLEMPKESQERRLDACLAGIVANEIRDGRLSEEDREQYFRVLKFQEEYVKQFKTVDMPRGISPREIELKYVESCDEFGIDFDLVVVDYLALMEPDFKGKASSDWLDLGVVSEALHNLARVHKIPVVTATQLNRPKDPNKSQHSTDRIARSNMIPDNANIILQIACRGDDEHTRLDMPVYITKMRDGEKGSFTLTKDFARMKVTNLVDETFGEDDDDLGL